MQTKQKEKSQEKMESTKGIHMCKHIALGFLCQQTCQDPYNFSLSCRNLITPGH